MLSPAGSSQLLSSSRLILGSVLGSEFSSHNYIKTPMRSHTSVGLREISLPLIFHICSPLGQYVGSFDNTGPESSGKVCSGLTLTAPGPLNRAVATASSEATRATRPLCA